MSIRHNAMAGADVIIVLGAAVKAANMPSNALRRRVKHAVDLFKAGGAPWLLMTGGVGQYPPAEAELMKALAIASGVPENAILTEPFGNSTLDSARKCLTIMKNFGLGKALVVTDDFHIRRAVMVFQRFGIDAQGDGVPYDGQMPLYGYWFYVLRDWLALIWYKLLLCSH